MSPPSPTVQNTSQSKIKKKPNQSASNASPSTKRKRQPKKKDNNPVKTNELLKTLAVPPLVPAKSNWRVSNKKNPETLKMIQVSDVINQPVPKLIKSNTLPPNFESMSKLQMINTKSKEASNVKMPTKNVSAVKTIEQASPQILDKSSSMPKLLAIDKCSPSKTNLATPKSNNVSIEQTSKKVVSKMKITPETQKNASPNILKNKASPTKKVSPKAAKPKPSGPHTKRKETSNEKQPNNRSAPTPKINITHKTQQQKEELNNSKRRPTKSKRDSDMREPAQKIESIYIADGLREDCENLVEKCLQVFKLNFEKFCEIWKQMEFPRVFHGRQSGAEIAEFSEEAIHIAKSHMVAKNVNFEENVAGLFLVYAFLNHQPYKGFAALRLVPEDVPSVLSLEAEARKQRRYDVLYILGSVLIKGPCEYHVLPREVALEMPIRKYHDGSVQISGPNIESVFSKTAECVQHFKELIGIDQRYAAIRQKIRDRHGGVDKVRNLCKQPAAHLFDMYRSYVSGGVACERDIETVLNKTKAPPEDENRVDLVKSIKERAMANIVDPMRHLTGVGERQEDTSPDEVPKSSRYKGKGKGKGRSSARTLQRLFAPAEEKEEVIATEFSQKAMPILNMSEDMLTVTHLALPTPSKRTLSLSSSVDDKPPNKRTKLDISEYESKSFDGNSVEKQTENLEKNSSATKTKVKRVRNPKKVDKAEKKHEQETKSNSDFNPDEIDKISIDVLVDGNDKIKQKIDNKNKSQSQILDTVIKVPKGKKSNAKNIKIKSIQIIKPANASKTEKAAPPREEINIQLDSIPFEILSGDKNIEIEIIDNFKGDIEASIENEKTNLKDAASSKKDSSCKVKSTDSGTKAARKCESVKDVKSTNTLSTELIEARFQRRKKRESKRLKKQKIEGVHKQNFDSKDKTKKTDPINEKDSKSVNRANKPEPNLPSQGKVKATVLARSGKRNKKTLRNKSTF